MNTTANIAQADLGMNGNPAWLLYCDDMDREPIATGELPTIDDETSTETLERITDAIEAAGYAVDGWEEETGWTFSATITPSA